MHIITLIIILLVALIHLYIVYLEMVLWNTKKGIKAFGLKNKEFAEETKVMAANQGLYNGFLSAGFIFAISQNDMKIAIFFLICVTIAGFYGSYSTKNIRLFFVQGIPAIITLIVLLINK